MKKKVGEYYRSKTTFSDESNKFLRGIDYQLVEIVYEDLFNLYIFRDIKDMDNDNQMFGDFNDEFDERFNLLKDERAKNINKLLYED